MSFRGALCLVRSELSTRKAATACLVLPVEDGIVGRSYRNGQVEITTRNNPRVDVSGKDGGFDFNLCALNICCVHGGPYF